MPTQFIVEKEKENVSPSLEGEKSTEKGECVYLMHQHLHKHISNIYLVLLLVCGSE